MANYKDVVRSDLSFINVYKDYMPIIDEVIAKLEGTSITGVSTGAFVSTSRKSILANARAFYGSLPGDYNQLFVRYASNPKNTFNFKQLKRSDAPWGNTTPIYGTNNSHIDAGYNSSFEDYTTTIHEYGHGIAIMLNPNQFYDVEKYCLGETDAIFLEMIGNDFTASRLNLEKESIDTSLDILDDHLADATYLYSKFYMYMKSNFKWTRTNIESYLRDCGYSGQEIEQCINLYFKDCFHYLISYLNAIELYLIYKQDKRSALDIALRIVKASKMNSTQYLNYVKSLGVVPGKNIHLYLEHLQKKDMELGNGKRLQYKIN